jgi:hypothetical protein
METKEKRLQEYKFEDYKIVTNLKPIKMQKSMQKKTTED